MILAVFIYFFHPRHEAQGGGLPILGVNQASPVYFLRWVTDSEVWLGEKGRLFAYEVALSYVEQCLQLCICRDAAVNGPKIL